MSEEDRAELERLRELVGPDEKSYAQLRLDVLAARDAAIGAEVELGTVRAYNVALEGEVVRLQRDFVWFRTKVVGRIRSAASGRPWLGAAIRRLSG